MRRESLNITLSESLRRAQIRQRLDALAEHTDLCATQIAGRALTIGLGLIESDLRLVFPGQPLTSAEVPSIAPSSTARPSAEKDHEAQPCAAMPSADAQRAAPASAAGSEKAEPSDTEVRYVSTAEIARVLGYGNRKAFAQHCMRHPELRKHSQQQGRARLWNLEALRAEYARNGWQPR